MALVSVSAPLGLEPLMSTFVRRTGARALDPTGYLSPSPSPASGDDSTPLGDAPATPTVAEASTAVITASEATGTSSAAPAVSPSVRRSFTPQTALPGVSEDTLRNIVEETTGTA
ncbi:hypothetical protein PC113_g10208 [Phytophthora cactorum]|uniref:Uncharacterized protein n=1 Tax=Phytophthora cactorum TaxID=29920 RepID=A0A8T0Z712_9STRA|nr:hypothetical protein PC111_g22544 [Phytophthora cactorum]KAG2858016.1 hypothetical protein PC113_g10208 [Phytophthora cactorum]KAG2904667.1 hypothetical protein PC117_g20974 [Phytophthora cactorum]